MLNDPAKAMKALDGKRKKNDLKGWGSGDPSAIGMPRALLQLPQGGAM